MRTAPPRRYLVLTEESARHPFRASLPPHVFAAPSNDAPEAPRSWRLGRSDLRRFLHTYCAGFAAITVFIA